MNILVLNSGSSSIKYNLWNMEAKELLCKGIIEKIGYDDSSMTCKNGDKEVKIDKKISSHAEGIQLIFNTLTDKSVGILNDIKEINAVGHRVVHGGEKITSSEVVTPEIKSIIKECIALAPLHNPHNLDGIEAIEKILPGIPNVAVFDTAFHSSMLPRLMYILSLMSFMRNIKYENTVSTGHPINMLQEGQLNSSESNMKNSTA